MDDEESALSNTLEVSISDHTSSVEGEMSRKRSYDDISEGKELQDNEDDFEHGAAKRSRLELENNEPNISNDAEGSGDTLEYTDWLEDDFFDRVVKQPSGVKETSSSVENGLASGDGTNIMRTSSHQVHFAPIDSGGQGFYDPNTCSTISDPHPQHRVATCTGDNHSRVNGILSAAESRSPHSTKFCVKGETVCMPVVHGEASGSHLEASAIPSTSQHNDPVSAHCQDKVDETPCLVHSESIKKDAEQIASLLNSENISLICNKLLKRHSVPNRVEVVINEMLEETIDLTKDNSEGDQPDEDAKAMEELLADVNKVIANVKAAKLEKEIDPNDVYVLLESHLKKPNRVAVVTTILVGGVMPKHSSDPSNPVDLTNDDEVDHQSGMFGEASKPKSGPWDIMKDVALVTKRFPTVRPDVIYEMLEERKEGNRVQLVLDVLAAKGAHCSMDCTDTGKHVDQQQPNELDMSGDPLYQEMVEISKAFPDRDKNEIYAYLQHYHDRPNRTALVTDELLGTGSQSQPGSSTGELAPSLVTVDSDTRRATETVGEDVGPLAQLQKDVDMMKDLFPDCDPYYLYESLEKRMNDPQRVAKLSEEMFSLRTYPKLKDRIEKEKKQSLKRRLEGMELNMDEFLATFPDPSTLFYDETKPVNANYRLHCQIQLKNYFAMLHGTFIDKKLDEHKGHFTPTLRDLENAWQNYIGTHTNQGPGGRNRTRRQRKSNMFRKQPRGGREPLPDVPDEYFYKEVLFTRHEQQIKDYIKQNVDAKAKRLEDARANGELLECGCCYDDEVLPEDMLACPEGHLFCHDCVRRSSEEIIGQSKVKFPCLSGDCESEFSTAVLQKVLSAKMLSNLLRKIQEEEVRQAGIPDLESCPFCSFATIMTGVDDKIFKCQNQECLKESCRLCKELNHIPLRCDEVEKQGETNMRTYIENKMAEAMIRVCWKCKKRFFKEEGCNKMTCSCGASMCYVCKKPIKGYEHFGPGGCPQDTDVFALHQEEIKKAGFSAKEQFTEENPDAASTELKHDPLSDLHDQRKTPAPGNFGFGAPVQFGGMPFPPAFMPPFPPVPFGGIRFGMLQPQWDAEDVEEDYTDDEDENSDLEGLTDDSDEEQYYW